MHCKVTIQKKSTTSRDICNHIETMYTRKPQTIYYILAQSCKVLAKTIENSIDNTIPSLFSFFHLHSNVNYEKLVINNIEYLESCDSANQIVRKTVSRNSVTITFTFLYIYIYTHDKQQTVLARINFVLLTTQVRTIVRNIHLKSNLSGNSSCDARFVNIFTSKETRIHFETSHRRTHVRILLSVSSTPLFPSLFFSALCPTLCRLRKQQASSIAILGTHTKSNLPNLRFRICN